EEAQVYEDPIVTEVKIATPFYKAEEEHFNYYNLNKNQPYCAYIIDPKIEKLKKYFKNFITI
ncbi:MAG: peptide-methionine (S)-S-oxide reductase, partial [Flavobacteriales bacterium]